MTLSVWAIADDLSEVCVHGIETDDGGAVPEGPCAVDAIRAAGNDGAEPDQATRSYRNRSKLSILAVETVNDQSGERRHRVLDTTTLSLDHDLLGAIASQACPAVESVLVD